MNSPKEKGQQVQSRRDSLLLKDPFGGKTLGKSASKRFKCNLAVVATAATRLMCRLVLYMSRDTCRVSLIDA